MFHRSLLLALLLGAPLAAEEITLGFDDVSAPGPFAFIVPGFANGPHLEEGFVTLDGGVILLDVLFGNSATSGGNILASCDTCLLGDGSGLPGAIDIVFDVPASSVALDVINGVASNGTFVLRAYDAADAVIASDSVVVGPMGSPTGVQPLAVVADDIARVQLGTTLPTGYTFAMDTLVVDLEAGVWVDLGLGLGGAQPAPGLVLDGPQVPGQVVQLDIDGGPSLGTAFLVVGLGPLNAAFKGGVLVPSPDIVVPLPLDGAGALAAGLTWPNGVPGGFSTYWQAWMSEPSGPAGFVATNGMQGIAP